MKKVLSAVRHSFQRTRNRAFLLLSFILAAVPVGGGAMAQSETSALDEIFSWTTREAPGCAVAVSKDGKQIVNRAYGLADLERSIQMTPETVFDIGSVQKQFVAAAVLLLVDDGRISLKDDIRTYFPELPDYGHTITVDHLLTHTSGLRDWIGLMRMSGGDEDALTLILRQQGLNFAPGEEWSYSNSGYVLLKELIARATGMSFAEFARKRVFEPLGMKSSQYAEDIHAAGERGARAYEKSGDSWEQDIVLGEERGGGAVLSTVGDLLIWNDALTNARLGRFVTRKIQEPAKLNNGRVLGYARGLFLEEARGREVVWHTGSAGAFKAMLARFPEHSLSLAILCNAGDTSNRARLAHQIVDLFAPVADSQKDAAQAPNSKADGSGMEGTEGTGIDGIDVSSRAGLFFSESTGEPLRLAVHEGRLRIPGGGPLVAVTADRFRNAEAELVFMSGDEFELHFVSPDQFELTSMEGETTRYRRAKSYEPTAAERHSLAGRYESGDLGAVLEIAVDAEQVTARLNDSRAFDLTPVARDTYQLGPMMLRFRRDAAGNVVGLNYSNPMLRNIAFTREGSGTDEAATETSAAVKAAPESSRAAVLADAPGAEDASTSPEALVGSFEAAPGLRILITLEDGTLYGEPTGQSKVPLVLKSGTTYFVGREGAPATVAFTPGEDRRAAELIVTRANGAERTFRRVP